MGGNSILLGTAGDNSYQRCYHISLSSLSHTHGPRASSALLTSAIISNKPLRQPRNLLSNRGANCGATESIRLAEMITQPHGWVPATPSPSGVGTVPRQGRALPRYPQRRPLPAPHRCFPAGDSAPSYRRQPEEKGLLPPHRAPRTGGQRGLPAPSAPRPPSPGAAPGPPSAGSERRGARRGAEPSGARRPRSPALRGQRRHGPAAAEGDRLQQAAALRRAPGGGGRPLPGAHQGQPGPRRAAAGAVARRALLDQEALDVSVGTGSGASGCEPRVFALPCPALASRARLPHNGPGGPAGPALPAPSLPAPGRRCHIGNRDKGGSGRQSPPAASGTSESCEPLTPAFIFNACLFFNACLVTSPLLGRVDKISV